MACDRFVYFKGKAPSPGDVQKILENYFGGCGVIEKTLTRWWIIALPGKPSATFEGIEGSPPFPRMGCAEDDLKRSNGIADQLARAFARFYQGRLEME